MKPLPRVWTLTFLPLAVAVLSEPAQGQDACPRLRPGVELGVLIASVSRFGARANERLNT